MQKAEKGNAHDGEYALLIPAGETSVTGGFAVAVLQARPTYVFCAWLKSPVDVTVDASLWAERYLPAARRSLQLKGELPVMASRNYLLPNDPNIGYEGPDDLSVKSRFCWTKKNLICTLTVTDDVHDPVNRNFWAGDSLPLAIDTGCNGTTGFDNVESSRKGNKTCYHMEIPWRASRFNPEPGHVIGLNFIINDSDADGRGRAYWMGLTPGIGEGKTPGVFRKFVLE